VHLDKPVNHYRWIRGFNEYDNWQASGVSGQGARSFYYPANRSSAQTATCPSNLPEERGNVNGYVHSHRFSGGEYRGNRRRMKIQTNYRRRKSF